VPPLLIKLIVILMLLVIVGSLVSALVFLYKDRGNGTRVAAPSPCAWRCPSRCSAC